MRVVGQERADSSHRTQLEKTRLENALVHLQESNDQLREALAQGPDAEYQAAIQENVEVMARYLGRVAVLDREIHALRGGAPMETEQPQQPQSAGEGTWL